MSTEQTYKVEWCPICDQGWIEIMQEVESNCYFVMCAECMHEWDKPEDIKTKPPVDVANRNILHYPSLEDIKQLGWEQYIIKDIYNYDI